MWQAGDKLGRFRLDREIGQGSHGVVFQATDTALDTPVAVKILHPWLTQDSAVRDRFKRELLLARRVTHPGVCRLFDLHEDGEAFFITMDYVEGQTLLTILKNEGKVQPLRGTRILRGVCQALAAAHNAGVIHRDLKPANIIVREGDNPMILDFGTATAGDVSRVTRPGTAVGSMRFIAPEVFTGVAPSVRTDLYSLGVVAYVTFAGKLPYNAASGALEMLEMIRNQPPQRLDALQPEVPARLADVVARAMEKNPDLRFASAMAFDEALAEVERTLTAAAPPTLPSTGNFSSWAATAIIRDAVVHNAPTALFPDTSSAEGPPSAGGMSSGGAMASAEGAPLASPDPSASAGPSSSRPDGPPVEPSGSFTAVDPATQPPATDASAPPSVAHLPERTLPASAESASGERTVRISRFAVQEAVRPHERPSGRKKLLWAAVVVVAVGGAVAVVGTSDGGGEVDGASDASARPGSDASTENTPGRSEGELAIAPSPNHGTAAAAIGLDAGMPAASPDVAAGDPSDARSSDARSSDAGALVAAMDFGSGDGEGEAAREGTPPPSGTINRREDGPVGVDRRDSGGSSTKKSTTATQLRPSARSTRFDEAFAAAREAMSRKGFIAGDLPAVEELLARARRSKDAKLAGQALAAVESQRVDRAFVLDKLKRFNARYDKSKQPDIVDKVDPPAREAASHFAAGRFEQANESLNRAFSLLRRTK